MAFAGLTTGVYTCVSGFINNIAKGNGLSGVGLYFIIYTATLMLSKRIISVCSKNIEQHKLLIPFTILFIISLLIIANARSIPMLYIGAIVIGVGNGCTSVITQVLSQQRVDNSQRGIASATYFTGKSIGTSLLPSVAGAIAGVLGYQIALEIMSIALVACLVIYFVFNREFLPE